jgi:signal transduction histidine kinase
MKDRASVRIIIYLLVLGLTTVLFVVGGLATWKARNFWEEQARQLNVDCIQFAQEYRASFLELNGHLLRYRLGRSQVEEKGFRAVARALLNRLNELDRGSFVPESREILNQLTDLLSRYWKQAEAYFENAGAPASPDLLAQADVTSARILALDQRLGIIQGQELNSFVTRVRHNMDWLWEALYSAMVIMLLSGGLVVWVAYRDYLAPLRQTVVRSQRLLEQKEKLASLGLLTAGMAHEIRNPLNSIKARLFTQRRVLGEGSAGLEDNQVIEEEVDRLEGIVKSALQFARPNHPSFERLHLQPLLQPWCKLLESSLRESHIELKSEFRADPEITADVNQLKQAILNLVRNAADSIGRNGTITLRTLATFVRGRGRKNPALAIEVQDTGQGISPETRQRLFDPFYTTKENGTGLGLSIAARIAHSHGGFIEVDSVPAGHGAIFRIVLPGAVS